MRWSPMDSASASNMPAWCSAVPAVSVPQGRIHAGFAMWCNSRCKESLIARRSTPWATTSSERTWDQRRSRWSREQAHQEAGEETPTPDEEQEPLVLAQAQGEQRTQAGGPSQESAWPTSPCD